MALASLRTILNALRVGSTYDLAEPWTSESARAQWCESYLSYPAKLAMGFANDGDEYLALVKAGNLGLMEGIDSLTQTLLPNATEWNCGHILLQIAENLPARSDAVHACAKDLCAITEGKRAATATAEQYNVLLHAIAHREKQRVRWDTARDRFIRERLWRRG